MWKNVGKVLKLRHVQELIFEPLGCHLALTIHSETIQPTQSVDSLHGDSLWTSKVAIQGKLFVKSGLKSPAKT